ncbi:hypothetical protein JCM1840_001098 [Sporobolomyces johnsonii]
MTAFEQSVLLESCTRPVTAAQLPALSPVQLAIASLRRQDLDSLTRQRAYHLFLSRRKRYRNSTVEPIFELPLDFALRPISSLRPSELLLLQFNELCTSQSDVDEAANLFFRAATAAQRAVSAKERETLASFRLLSYQTDFRAVETVKERNMKLELGSEALRVVQDKKVVLELESVDIRDFGYITANEDAAGQRDCTLAIKTSLPHSSESGLVTLHLGRQDIEQPSFKQLRETVAEWHNQLGFDVWLRRPDDEDSSSGYPPSKRYKPSPPSPTWRSSLFRPQYSPDGETADLPSPATEGIWRYLSEDLMDAEWTPGFWVRQAAFINAIAPDYDFTLLEFSEEEIALLSFRPDAGSLPSIPAVDCKPRRGHPTHERLSVEKIYAGYFPRIALSATRRILFTDEYPQLKAYARILGKVVLCRDLFQTAYKTLLWTRLMPRSHDPTTRDPIESITRLVQRLHKEPLHRIHHFTDDDFTCIRKSTFKVADIGIGPTRRFEAALDEICETEDRAKQRFLHGGTWEL